MESSAVTKNTLSRDGAIVFFDYTFAYGKAQATQMQRELPLQKSHALSEVSDGLLFRAGCVSDGLLFRAGCVSDGLLSEPDASATVAFLSRMRQRRLGKKAED